MFGVDESDVAALQARRTRRRRRGWRLLVLAVELLILLPPLAAVGLGWLLLTPEGLQWSLDTLREEAPSSLTVGDVALHPLNRWDDPAGWRAVFTDVRIVPDDPTRPRLSFARIVLGWPDAEALWQRQELHLDELWLIGFHIEAQQQRSGPKRPRDPDRIQRLVAGTVHVLDARYTAPADDPLPEAAVTGIYGTLEDVSYDPFSRDLDGTATLTAQHFRTGTLVFDGVQVDRITAVDADLVLEGGRLWWEGQPATVRGTVDDIDERATVKLTVRIEDAEVGGLVRSATGQPSPLYGTADIDLVVHSGGELPRGGGYMDGHAILREAIVPLPPETRPIYKDVIRILPIATLDEDDRVHLESMEGTLRLARGTAHIHELVYRSRPPILVRGEVDGERLDLIIRTVLRGEPETHPGLGLRIRGPHAAPEISRATRDELLPGWREAREERKRVVRWPWQKRREGTDGAADEGR